MNRFRLQSQIVLATFLPLLVFAILSLGVGFYALYRIPEELVLQRQTALAEIAASGISAYLRGYVRLLESLSGELSNALGNPAQQQQILDDRADALQVFSGGTVLLDERGTALAATPEAEASLGLNYAFHPYFRQVRSTLAAAFSAVLQDQPRGFTAVVIAVPVRRSGAFAGVLVGEFALERPEWVRDLALLRTPQGGPAYLIDRASTIIYHPDPNRVGGTVDNEPPLARLVTEGVAQSVVYTPSSASEPMIASFAPIPETAWGVITEESRQAILAPLVPYEWAVGGLTAAGLLLALAALVLSIRQVTRPLNALIAEGQRVAGGETFRPLQLQGPPDLRLLLAAVNQMVARLGDQQMALRRYALQVLRGQEEERLHLSHELHDETVQDLVGLRQRIELVADLMDNDPAAAREELQELETLSARTLQAVRRMSRNLRPSILEDAGLGAAVQLLARELGEQLPLAHIACQVEGTETRLPPELELTAFRVAQESLTNVRKHAASTAQVKITLRYTDAELDLTFEDDGPGFSLADQPLFLKQGHLGLAGMVERVELFGGKIEFHSTPGSGTRVIVRLPYLLARDSTGASGIIGQN